MQDTYGNHIFAQDVQKWVRAYPFTALRMLKETKKGREALELVVLK